MLDELIDAMENFPEQTSFTMSVALDEKGYYDRICPNSECGGLFKVLFEDWRDKVADERVYCPFCRHEAVATELHTPEQEEHIKSAAMAKAIEMLNETIGDAVARSRPHHIDAGLLRMSMSLGYTPGDIPPVIPAEARQEFRQDFTCEECGCRYASLGASFFCPACGHNSATSCFDSTLETVRKTVAVLEPMRATLELTVNVDTARDAVRQLLEDQFARLVGAFERLNEALFDKLPTASQFPKKGSVFQRVDDASLLWQQASGKGYPDFLSPTELQRMKLMFQRRHVLSHRQGIVDQAYISKSGDAAYAVGQRLVIRDRDVLELVELFEKLTRGLRALVP